MNKFLILLAVLLLFFGSYAFARPLDCGSVISADAVLKKDLVDCSGNGIVIDGDNITLDCRGRTIDGMGSGYGIYLYDISGVTIKDCRIQQFDTGIKQVIGADNIFTGNSISDNEKGIHLAAEVYAGTLQCNLNTVSENRIYNNTDTGIKLDNCQNNQLLNNTIESNGAAGTGGIFLNLSRNNTITGNTITGNSNGIHLRYETRLNEVANNLISGNNIGIYLTTNAGSNQIHANTIKDNTGYGLRAIVTVQNNFFYNNYFENTINAVDIGQNTWAVGKTPGTNIVGGPYIAGNYWHDYLGEDLDGDGIGDTDVPYTCDGRINFYGKLRGDPRPLTMADSDGDGVPDNSDLCPNTTLPEQIPTIKLVFRRYADVDGDRIFETGEKKSEEIIDSQYTLTDTLGCSCEQILETKPGKISSEKNFGCTKETMDKFIN